MRPHSAAIWELLREIWEWRARNGNHPWLAACTLPSRVDPGLVIFFYEDSISSPVIPFILILLTSKCPFDGPDLLTNPVPWVETRKSVYHQIHSPYPWISKFRAKNRNFWGDLQVPAWVPDTPASRSDLSALYTTLSRLDQVQNQTPSFLIGDGFTKKSCCSFGFCPNYLPAHPPLNLDNLYHFFWKPKTPI